MHTIEYYLRQLDYYRNLLISNLRSLGITCDDNEKFNTLVPKIYGLANSGGVIVQDYNLYGYSGSQEDIEKVLDRVTTINVPKDLKGKFGYCANLVYLPLFKINTSEVTSITGIVLGVNTDLTIDASNCDLSKVTSTSGVGTDTWDSKNTTKPVARLNLQNAKLSMPAYLALTSGSPKLTTIDNLDTLELVIDKTQPVNITGFLNGEGLDIDLSPILNQLEGTTIKFSGNTFLAAPNMTYPVILPKCSVELPTSGYLYAREFGKCKHLDFSNAEITNVDKITNLTFYGNFFGGDLTDEELEGAVYKLYSNFTDITYSTFSLVNNKACGDLNLDGLHLTSWNALTFNDSYLKNVDYTTFTLDTMPTASTTIFGSRNNWNSFPKLEVFKYDKGGYLNCSDYYDPGFYFGNVPNLKHFELRNVTINYIHGLFYNGRGYHSNTEVENIIIEDCIFKSNANNFSGITKFKSVKYLSYKNCVFESSNQSSCVLSACARKCQTIDCTGVDFGHVTKVSRSTFGYSGDSVTNYIIPNNIGKSFTAQTVNNTDYELYFKDLKNLNKESLLDIINKVYDLNISYGVYDEEGNAGTGTLYTQKLVLGETNLAKLTPEEIAIATNKGWTVS